MSFSLLEHEKEFPLMAKPVEKCHVSKGLAKSKPAGSNFEVQVEFLFSLYTDKTVTKDNVLSKNARYLKASRSQDVFAC